ncbi:hypothetical protein NYZ99_03560 [Maribacter litopenaei]|jgi:hypothetical protein|uniref:Uncharacterized protein n=1 Tax=Maribacter litopenaei TaxID=2976127 RepID=A0ABY5Y978_9FLAO|nr:hypothetical protein [Maribacter litopenaei]UWX55571.1 hypothetical protein NYZ99_03560 [Maribacter litopenaei]
MAEEVIRPKDALKSCFFIGCGSMLAVILIAIAYLVYLHYFYDPLS